MRGFIRCEVGWGVYAVEGAMATYVILVKLFLY